MTTSTPGQASLTLQDGNWTRGPLMSPEGFIFSSICLFFIGIVGFFCNGLVIYLYCKDKNLWTPLNIILFNLVMGDFAVALLGTPITFAASVSRTWIFGREMCVCYGFFMALLGITSISTLTILAFERYLVISRPFGGVGLNRWGAAGLIFGAWTYSLVLTVPPIFGWGEYTNEAANISCSINWESQEGNAKSYILFLFSFGLFIPVIVILWSYINIITTIRQNTLRMGQVNKAQNRIGLMVAVMIVAFLVAWSPYAGFSLYATFSSTAHFTPAMAVAPALFAKSSICYNPFIYVALNKQFRASWWRIRGYNTTSTSVEADAERSVAVRGALTCTQQTTLGTMSPERVALNTKSANFPLLTKQLRKLQKKEKQEQRKLNQPPHLPPRNKERPDEEVTTKFHTACLVALVKDSRNLSTVMQPDADAPGETSVRRPSLLAQCCGQDVVVASDQTNELPSRKQERIADRNNGVEVIEVQVRKSDVLRSRRRASSEAQKLPSESQV